MTWHCPYCGDLLEPIPEEHPTWGSESAKYRNRGEVEFLCTRKECTLHNYPVVLFHPVYGLDHRAGDSWALGLVE